MAASESASLEDSQRHWQLGQVQQNGKWVSTEELQRQAAVDPLQAEYRKRRSSATSSVQDQIALARWCRDNKLGDEAQLHWEVALSLDPANKEAQHATDTILKNGQLINRSSLAERKQRVQEAKDAAKHWDPIVDKWQLAVSGRDIHSHDAALAEIRDVSATESIPSIEAATLGREAFDTKRADGASQIATAFLDALSKIPTQVATESILRHAVLAPAKKVRALAIEKLKARPQNNYVPLLLSGLAMPIESTYNVVTDAGGSVHYVHSLYREGPDQDVSIDANFFSMQHVLPGRDLVFDRQTGVVQDRTERTGARAREMAAVARLSEAKYSRTAAATESQVQMANSTAEQVSAQIIPVLAATTGKDYESPKQWWDWWRDTNEYYTSEHPVEYRYYSNTETHNYGHPYDSFIPAESQHSCFAKGTPVWTKTGLKPIESLDSGDFVLSQNVNTGELVYKPVVKRTMRPTGKIEKVSLDGEILYATTGHPFWVSGVGWRMVKELSDGAILHCVSGNVRVQSIEDSTDAEAYNLVVSDFNTYFVGKKGSLVHDITPRRPTDVVEPGVVAAIK
ncbi:MAG TPA: polymorphic toxin-type HINT domain-containing protein [Lacipirellulaceae bacterium]|nr:polymorphic toxin-type HINT domain-containing protein [Lacipirellulaceae bacterium]